MLENIKKRVGKEEEKEVHHLGLKPHSSRMKDYGVNHWTISNNFKMWNYNNVYRNTSSEHVSFGTETVDTTLRER